MATIGQDIRYALRVLGKNPRFTAIAVLTLAIGIGANTAIFSVVNSILLNPLPYANPERLVAIFTHEVDKSETRNATSPADFVAWADRNNVFENMTAAQPWAPVLTGSDRPVQPPGLKASVSLFELLGVSPLLGRTLVADDGSAGSEHVVVLGYPLWQQNFGGDGGIVGRSVTLDGESHSVIGVMPEGFQFPPFWASEAMLWAPLVLGPEAATDHSRGLRIFAGLRPGVSPDQAQANMDLIAQGLVEDRPRTNTDIGVNVERLREPVVSGVRTALVALLGAVGFVLLIACSNVAGLILSRAAGRRREIAVRAALGAGRSRLVRQLLAESATLSLLGAVTGLGMAYAGVELLVALAPGEIPRLGEIGIDLSALAFTLLVSVIAAVVFGLFPALQVSKSDLTDSLKQRSTTQAGTTGRRLGQYLTASEVALAMVLLVGASLMVHTMVRLGRTDTGFDSANAMTMSISLAGSQFAPPERQQAFFNDVLGGVGSLPGVVSAGLVNHVPVGGDTWRLDFTVDGSAGAPDPGRRPNAVFRVATPGYEKAFGLRLIGGRWFENRDRSDSPGVVVVNELLARRYWGREDPEGMRLRLGATDSEAEWLRVVGVVGDTIQSGVEQSPVPEIYFPYTQNPVSFWTNTSLVVRAAGNPAGMGSALREAVWDIDPNLPVSNVQTVAQVLRNSLGQQRFNTTLLALLASIALLLALVGIYGVISYSVSQRRHEIGVRTALGAGTGDIVRLFLTQGMKPVLIGLAVGLLASLWLTRFISSLLFGVGRTDAPTLAIAALLMATTALAASYLPARAASRKDPLEALRSE